ncbi:DNA modification methylase [Streptococcus gordonii]|uniref:DNA modification methylase n=1 Tax=Streptococcus gordonii TaxID=1302 RepID=A0A139N0J5_STRGN|nr:DNA modification methylase [Streptococcus gordonii]
MDQLQIEYVDIGTVKPYYRNARHNDGEATEKLAESIKEFGFQQPILVDDNNIIITGHTRIKAALSLGIDKIPIARAVGLSDEQIKAYRLADNRVAEYSTWDKELLDIELAEFETIDMSKFGFELSISGLDFGTADPEKDQAEEEPEDFHRETTINQYNLFNYDPDRTEGKYNMPILDGVDHVPADLQGFNYVLNKPDTSKGVHFFLDDYQFERIWQRPEFYIEKLIDFDCALTPDFSLYLDMPIAMQVWNIYRSRLIGQIMQDYGITVIPTVSWSTKDSFDFCFDGLPQNATLAVSTIGVKQDKEQFEIWIDGMNEMIERLSPTKIIVYGGKVDYDYKDIEVVYFDNATTERMKSNGR